LHAPPVAYLRPVLRLVYKEVGGIQTVVSVDLTEYHISQVEQLVGMLVAMLGEAMAPQPGQAEV